MRGKKAKQLRQEARAETVGKPGTQYCLIKHPQKATKVGPHFQPRRFWHNTSQIRLTDDCTRRAYRQKKKRKYKQAS